MEMNVRSYLRQTLAHTVPALATASRTLSLAVSSLRSVCGACSSRWAEGWFNWCPSHNTHTQQDLFSDATALDLPAAGQVPTHHASDLAPMEETRFLDTQG